MGTFPTFYQQSKILVLDKVLFITGRGLIPSAILAILCILIYSPVFSHEFQNKWDDQWVAINRYTEGGLNLHNLWIIVSEFYHGQYAPVNQLYYTLLYTAFGYNPFAFHSAGLLMHIINVLLVYFLIKKLLYRTHRFEDLSIQRIAFLTALLVGIHPFLVEAVAWIAASKILLYACFYLIALHCYLNYTASFKIKYYFLTLLFFIISFGGKEQAVTLPVCLLLVDYALSRDMLNKKVWIEKIPFFLLSIFFGVITMLSQADTGDGVLSDSKTYPFHQNIVFASYSLFEYFTKCLIPIKLSYIYPFPNVIGEPLLARFLIYPFVLIVLAITFGDFLKQRWVFFGIIFFIIHLGVALHIIPISRFAIIADRYVYISAIGVFFTIAWLLDRAIIQRVRGLNIVLSFSLLYVLSLGIYAHQHTKVWHNSDTLKNELKQLLEQRNDYLRKNNSDDTK